MPELVYYVASSLDGHIATPDGGVEWLNDFFGVEYGFHDFYDPVDATWMGRGTYEKCLEFGQWPYPGKASVVFTHAALSTDRDDVRFTSAPPAVELERAAREGHRKVWLVGGGGLATACRAAGVITEYIVTVIPVVLGAGIPLLARGGPVERLTLHETKHWENGVVQLRYRSTPRA
jgi:dihydrofolate reductase